MSEEKIGNVILDLTYYKGSDAYSDGDAVEDRLLDIVKSGENIRERLMKSDDWAELYHLSDIRKNILSWADMGADSSVLEIGAGCGAVTGILCEKCKSVTCVDLSKKRSTINAYRNAEYDNLRIMVGNFEDVQFSEKFDCITLIGVFEYSIYYISSDDPFVDMLKKCRSLLKENGKLYIAIENKYGMKYFAGAKEDHTGKAYDGIEGYSDVDRVRTFSGYALNEMLKEAGFSGIEFRYPVPDYKLPMALFSDDRLPAPEDITYRSPNYDRDRVDSFDELKVTRQICADGMFPDFANSFVISACNGEGAVREGCLYAKFNTLRVPEYRVDTFIKLVGGIPYVIKSPACKEAVSHIDNIEANKEKVEKFYRTTQPALFKRYGDDLCFEFYCAAPFDEDCIDYSSAKLDDICADLNSHTDMLLDDISDEYKCTFEMTDKFREFFGEVEIPAGTPGLKEANIDMIFGNFLVTDYAIICIDYEWFTDFPVPYDFIKYRICRHVFESNENVSKQILTRQEFAVKCGIEAGLVDALDLMEDRFQQKVTGNAPGVRSLTSYEKDFTTLDAIVNEYETRKKQVEDLEKTVEVLADKNRDLERITGEQQAYIEKLKKAIKNPLFGLKWAVKKISKK